MPRASRKRRKPRGSSSGRPPGRPPGSSSAASGDLGSALAGLRAVRTQLLVERTRLDERLTAIDHALSKFGEPVRPAPAAAAGGRARLTTPTGRAPRAGSLPDVITRVLQSGGTMRVKDVAAACIRAGYKTRNQTFAKSVGITLARMNNVQRVGRGRFRLK